nr:non-ribosomal peptide synthetase [uncultured Chitinophaga sp.]
MEDLLRRLKQHHIVVSLDKSDLKVKFNGTKISDELVSELKQHKAALVAYLTSLKEKEEDNDIVPAGIQPHYPLSSSQHRLWMLCQLEDGNIAYNMPGVCTFEGPLDYASLAAAMDTLIERHESLRTVFREDGSGAVRQFILSPEEIGFAIGHRDLRAENDKDAVGKKLVQEALYKPFDLATGPLVRICLFRVEDHKWIFVYVMHHIISDGRSTNVLVQELLTLYSAYTRQKPDPLRPLTLQYKDYAVWEQKQLGKAHLRIHENYWLQQFSGPLPVLDFPVDNKRPAVRSYNGRTISKSINARYSKAIRAASQEKGGTLFMGLLALVNMLLYRYTGQEDLVVGTPIAGREHADLENQIGFYLNTLALRTKFNHGQSFNELLENIRQITLSAYEHQVYPFDKLIDKLALKRDLSRNPLFDVMILLQNTNIVNNAAAGSQMGDIKIARYAGGEGVVSKYDLTFYFTETGETIRLDIEYNNDLFNKETIEGIWSSFESLTNVAVNNPEATIQELIFMAMPPAAPPASFKGTAPAESHCSEHQRRLWFIDQFEKNNLYEHSPVYHNLPLVVKIAGPLEVTALNAAARKQLAGHAILRSRIITRNSEPFLVVSDAPVDDVRYRVWPACSDEKEVVAGCEAIIDMPFNIDEDQLVRFDHVCYDTDKYLLIITAHHLVADRASLVTLFNGLMNDYHAFSIGTVAVTSEPLPQYAEYAAWQLAMPAEAQAAPLFYWKNTLKDAPILYLDTDQPREHIHIYKSAFAKRKLTTAVSEKLRAWCREKQIAPSEFLFAAFNALLFRYTGSEEIVTGTFAGNRKQDELRPLIGPLSNLVTLKINANADMAFEALLRNVSAGYHDAVRFADVPFEKVVLEVNPGKDMSRTALFDVIFHYEEPAAIAGGFEVLELNHGLGKYDFNLLATGGACFEFCLTYNGKYFNRAGIERLLTHLTGIISAALETPLAPLSALQYLSAEEIFQLVTDMNDTQSGFPGQENIVSLFEAQVAATPDNIAVVFEDIKLTYRELNEAANRLGNYLRSNYRLAPGDLAGMLLERSEKIIVAIMGILKAGAAYVPIDPQYPKDRIDYMMEDSGCRVVIDEQEFARFSKVAHLYDNTNPLPVNSPGDLAYVIYTSGTTGMPKGTLIEHRNVVRLMKPDRRPFDFGPSDVWTMFHSYCFDFSVWEMYGALLFGGKVIVVPVMTARDAHAFLAVLQQHGVTVLNQTPSAFDSLVKVTLSADAPHLPLRYVIFGGEALSPASLKEWHQKYPDARLINMYGITETTVHVTYKEITDAEIATNNSNIGKPIPTLTCYVLDPRRNLLPVGISGELYVGGDGVCRGYLNKKELTDARFIESPFRPGERLYRSGDKVKRLDNGEMEYAGRIDDQVKIRGYRIELGEVENVLRQHPLVEEAIVIASKDDKGDSNLVAYIISKSVVDIVKLRQDIALHIPAYMLPAYFVQLDAIPLTSNGKTDKKNLPAPSTESSSAGEAYVAPRNTTEALLAAIWHDVLGKEGIGAKDNFFELGGHSLKATRLISQIHKEMDVKLALKDIFTNPVLEEQALLLSQMKKEAFVAIAPAPVQAHYPLSSSQRRLWVLSQFEDAGTAYNMTGVQVFDGLLDREVLQSAFDRLVARHESLRTVFRYNEAGEIRQYILAPEDAGFLLEHEDLRTTASAEDIVRARVAEIFTPPFDLQQGPLLRAGLFRTGDSKWVLAHAMHHIISDGWSMGILSGELLQIYHSLQDTGAVVLPPLRLQYKDYAVWQQEQLHSGLLNDSGAYWLRQMEGDLPVLQLPASNPRPAVKTFNGGRVCLELDKDTTQALRNITRRQGATLFMGLLAAVNTLLYRYSGQEDMIIGSPVAGRPHADLNGQIGFYINTLALRSRFSGSDSYEILLDNVKQVTLDAYEHQLYPFDELVDALPLTRDMSRSSLFDVMVVLQNNETATAGNARGLRGVKEGAFGQDTKVISKFDLTFNFQETGDTLQTDVEYNSDIYTKEFICQMTAHLHQLLAVIVADPAAPLFALDYLGEAQKNTLLRSYNEKTIPAFNTGISVLHLFEEQAKLHPDNVALEFKGVGYSYGELNEKANQFAAWLQTKYQLAADDIVAIQLDRSQWMIIALLGILKAGAAYLPVDPGYPAERIAYLLSDSQARLIVDTVQIADFIATAGEYPKENPAAERLPGQLAYVIYTSGSTGQPKGCAITTANLSAYVQWANSYYFAAAPAPTFGLFTSLSFDLTVTSIFCPLTLGGRLLIYEQDAPLEDILRHSFSKESSINSIKLTPSHISLLKHLEIPASGVLCAIVGGEEVTPEHVNILKQVNPAMHVYNEYGPTEATVGCIVKELQAGVPVLIGKPVTGADIYILDRHMQLCPEGVPGEICIGGAGLAKEYLGKPVLTAQKFVPNPFAPGERLYRTGDLGRWLPGGDIACMGRIDDQVKVRGHRIELGEIEIVLGTYAAVDSAIVVTRTTNDGQKELVAYVAGKETIQVPELRAYLQASIPAYMIPDHIVQLDTMPLTSNGKVDRKRLPDPETLGIAASMEYVPPSSPLEKQLVAIWQEVLNKQEVGIKDNFFDLGGNSIRLIRMVMMINKLLPEKITTVAAFRFPTVQQLAAHIRSAGTVTNAAPEEELTASVSIMEETFNVLNLVRDEQ